MQLARWMACLQCLVPVAAGAAEWTDIDAEALVALCWAISEEDRGSGVTSRMRQGTADTIDCLEQEIVQHATAFFRTRSEEQIRQLVTDIGGSYAQFYWVMYNENKACDPGCGTVYHVVFIGEVAELLEDMLRDLVSQRNEYRR